MRQWNIRACLTLQYSHYCWVARSGNFAAHQIDAPRLLPDCRRIAAIQRYVRARPLQRKLTEPVMQVTDSRSLLVIT